MSYLDAIILGVVQGLTEFLPISSSGHLVVVQKLLGIEQHDIAFDVAAHLGTLCAILTIYYALAKRLIIALFNPRQCLSGSSPEGRLIQMIFWGSLPTAVIGLGFKHQFESLFTNLKFVGTGFIITGLVLLLSKLKGGAHMNKVQVQNLDGIEKIDWWKAMLIGVAQGLAIAPSISRSGSTIIAGLLLGLPGATAAMFSFMLSLPAVAGAAVLELKDVAWESSRIGLLATGLITAYLAGVVGLWGTLQVVKKGRLEVFTIYLVALGIFILWTWV